MKRGVWNLSRAFGLANKNGSDAHRKSYKIDHLACVKCAHHINIHNFLVSPSGAINTYTHTSPNMD